ncbi:hypothetical protein AVEN_187942-1 [Araneus ventricosus]|uniref:Uncharacterized protein n=1 Tax=Araneus ventricosus TaxID=182803 RepID=A0A4Y2DYI3_ARAVE|nr:hypothetical protein AVEN_187942-1 [Araneus ventricosus]
MGQRRLWKERPPHPSKGQDFLAPCQKPEIVFATGHDPFPTYLKRFSLRTTDFYGCGELGSPLLLSTSCGVISLFHLKKPSNDLEQLWWKRVLNNPLSRIKI